MWEDLIRIQFRMTKYFSFYKRGRSIHILGLHWHFLWVRLRISVMDEMSFEVWNSTWASCMQMKRDTFIFSFKGNLILLFFTRSKFNIRDHALLLLVLRKCFRVDQTTLIWKSSNVCNCRWRPNDCFLHANVATYYFLVSKGNSTLLFFTRE